MDGETSVLVQGRVRRLWAIKLGLIIASLARAEFRIGKKGKWRRSPLAFSVKIGDPR